MSQPPYMPTIGDRPLWLNAARQEGVPPSLMASVVSVGVDDAAVRVCDLHCPLAHAFYRGVPASELRRPPPEWPPLLEWADARRLLSMNSVARSKQREIAATRDEQPALARAHRRHFVALVDAQAAIERLWQVAADKACAIAEGRAAYSAPTGDPDLAPLEDAYREACAAVCQSALQLQQQR